MCEVAPWLQAHGFGSPQQLHTTLVHAPNYANAAASTAVAAATAALVHLLFQLQYLRTATYKRMRFFWERAVGGRTFNGGASTAAVLQRKLGEQQRPPPRLSAPRLLGGAGRSSHGGSTEIASSLRRAIRFPPGAHCASRSPEMGQEKTQTSLTIAPQSSEQTEKP